MRIAVSGAHRTGKTTLVEALHRALPGLTVVDEPYHLLVEDGHPFAAMPGPDDFELQLERSLELIADSDEDCIFDRCPADLLAYLTTHPDGRELDLEPWLLRSREAMARLDLVVYVPIETPDRMPVADPDDDRLRTRVDREVEEIVIADRYGFGVRAVEVTGTDAQRVRQVLRVAPAAIGRAAGGADIMGEP